MLSATNIGRTFRGRQHIRNPWSTKRHRPVVSATILAAIGLAMLLTLVSMAMLLMRIIQPDAPKLRKHPPASPGSLRPVESVSSSSQSIQAQPKESIKVAPPPPPLNLQAILHPEMPSMDMDPDQVGTDRPTTVDAFRQAFEARFGPTVAPLLRNKALQAFGSVHATADRIVQAKREGRPFRFAFAGYSITVGRGNYYHQSYPFVLYHLLEPLFQHALEMDLTVKNAAIGGIPSFPYGFCLNHFLGGEEQQADVLSWDYSMNEQGNTAILEAYVRHAHAAYPHTRPLILALEKHKGRCDLLRDYTEKGLLPDALCVAKASDIIPKSTWENNADKDESSLPRGLQQWKEFGAPGNCPGRGSWHPKKMEHAAIAWTMAWYFVEALELAVESIQGGGDNDSMTKRDHRVQFPKPLSSNLPDNPPAIQSLLYGHVDPENPNSDAEAYRMHKVSCRTNFLPAEDHDNLLTSIVTSGFVKAASAESILETRSDEMYKQGWVLDVSPLERDTKIKVDKCGGLGYVDMKIALYGAAESGPLHLWLPVDDTGHESHNHHQEEERIEADTQALHWIESLVVCEANEKRPDTACRLTDDLQYTVGGVVIDLPVPVLHGAAEYLKRPTCVALAIPADAKLTQNGEGGWGLAVEVQPASHVTREGGACCLSHVVWEHALYDEPKNTK